MRLRCKILARSGVVHSETWNFCCIYHTDILKHVSEWAVWTFLGWVFYFSSGQRALSVRALSVCSRTNTETCSRSFIWLPEDIGISKDGPSSLSITYSQVCKHLSINIRDTQTGLKQSRIFFSWKVDFHVFWVGIMESQNHRMVWVGYLWYCGSTANSERLDGTL